MEAKTISKSLMFLLLFLGRAASGSSLYIEAKGSYFRPSEKIFQDIYKSGFTFGGEIGIDVWKRFGIWVEGDYFNKKGKLTLTREETEIQIFPIGGGLSYRWDLPWINPYVGAGFGYFQYKETSPIGTVEKGNWGFLGHAGFLLDISSSFFFDLQMSYSSCKVKPAEVEADLGGIRATLGLGYKF